jgi:uncharacterized membrane protein YhhN
MVLLPLTLLFALLEWFAIYKGRRRLEYLAKPAVMLCLLGWMLLARPLDRAFGWFVAGAVFSLAGDVFLLLKSERRGFLLGLGAFLLAHIAYIIGLGTPLAPFTLPHLWIAFLVLCIALGLGIPISSGLLKKGLARLLVPVCMYQLALSLMLFSALSTLFRADWPAPASWTVSLGAALFVASDSLLAWNKFVRPVKQGRLALMVLYHLGQLGIIVGAVMQSG